MFQWNKICEFKCFCITYCFSHQETRLTANLSTAHALTSLKTQCAVTSKHVLLTFWNLGTRTDIQSTLTMHVYMWMVWSDKTKHTVFISQVCSNYNPFSHYFYIGEQVLWPSVCFHEQWNSYKSRSKFFPSKIDPTEKGGNKTCLRTRQLASQLLAHHIKIFNIKL